MSGFLQKINKFFTNRGSRTLFLAQHGFYGNMSDEDYLKMRFKAVFGRELDLNNPVTFNEKLQWLKLYDRRPEYTKMVDKYTAKKYVADIIGKQYIIPTLGVWDKFDDIDFDKLPDKFVLKCTHDSGGIVICRDKASFDKKAAKKKLEKALKKNYYYESREWPYKDVPKKIIAEEFISDADDKESLSDYKFFCFDGKADCVMLCFDRESGETKFYFFDKEWKLKRLNKRGLAAPEDFTLPKPEKISEMFEIAQILSTGIPAVRIDLYQSNGRVYFGEMTFFPTSGWDVNLLPETDRYFGDLIKLPQKTLEKQ